ncbi:MAG: putative sulfate/molybdate transporter [Deltaproteobacteria bacterium]|nr:MAG: putative sulfate/molybdate transporter [Deltaproteobacteria bacterium]
MKGEPDSPSFRFTREEISGSLGDLGTFLPLTLGYIAQCGLSPAPVFFFAGLWNFVTGLLFRLPIPVQPMKAIAAVAIAEGMNPGEIAAAGILMGGMVFLIGISARAGSILSLTPWPVVRGIQLGIGLKILLAGVQAILPLPLVGWDSLLVGAIAVSLIVLSSFHRKVPAALILFFLGFCLLWVSRPGLFGNLGLAPWTPELIVPSPADWWRGFTKGAIAQIPLTLLNSVVAVCALSGELFPGKKIPEAKMARSVGVMNLFSCWFGGMPVCHGAGGLAGQYHFGARTGGSVVFLGGMKMVVGVAAASALLSPLKNFPQSILGALLIFAGLELSLPARDLPGREDFLVALLTAGLILSVNVTAGFLAGILFWTIFNGRKHG